MDPYIDAICKIEMEIGNINKRLDKLEGEKDRKPFYNIYRNKLVSAICFYNDRISFCDKEGYFTSEKYDNPISFRWNKFNYANTVKLFVDSQFSNINIYVYAIRFLTLKGYKISKFDPGWPNELYFTKD